MTLVREAMVVDPRSLGVDSTAREAGELLANEDVRAVFVCDEGQQLVGVLTRKTLVREVVARGKDPNSTRLGDIAEPPYYTFEAEASVEDAFRFMEEQDAERVPVVEAGRLVGVLSRAVVQRRLAEDEPVEETV
ncbi:MAG TPA: CBS domain-containing protein [Gaiellaceae bacterium]